MAQLKDAKARLAGVQNRLAELQKGFDDAVAKKQVRKRETPPPSEPMRLTAGAPTLCPLSTNPPRDRCLFLSLLKCRSTAVSTSRVGRWADTPEGKRARTEVQELNTNYNLYKMHSTVRLVEFVLFLPLP